MEGVIRLWLPTHPHHPATPPPIHPPPYTVHAIPDVTVAVKKVAHNSVVSAN